MAHAGIFLSYNQILRYANQLSGGHAGDTSLITTCQWHTSPLFWLQNRTRQCKHWHSVPHYDYHAINWFGLCIPRNNFWHHRLDRGSFSGSLYFALNLRTIPTAHGPCICHTHQLSNHLLISWQRHWPIFTHSGGANMDNHLILQLLGRAWCSQLLERCIDNFGHAYDCFIFQGLSDQLYCYGGAFENGWVIWG